MAAIDRVILLTGGTGFVGRQIFKALAGRGAKVRLVVRDGTQGRLAQSDAIESVVTTPDLFAEDSAWWRDTCRDVDTIIHSAWYAEPGQYLQSPKNSDCLKGTLQLAQGAIDAKVRRFIGVGTCFEYDFSAGTLGTDTRLKPLTPYAQAKVEAFRALSQSLPAYDVGFAWCRLFYLHGEGEDARRLFPVLHARLRAGEPVELTSGTQIRDYLDVHEAGSMVADVALGATQGPVNICSGIGVTIRSIAEGIADQYGRRDLLRFGARPDAPNDPPVIVGLRK